MLNRNKIRVLLGAFIALLVLTALFILVEKTSLAITGYCFGILAIIEFFGTIYLVAAGNRNAYLTNAAFPLVSIKYIIANITCSVIFTFIEQIGIWTIPVGWFAFIQIVLIAVFSYLILSMDAGQEEIINTGNAVAEKVFNWKTLLIETENIITSVPAEYKKFVVEVHDSIRYADPMTPEGLQKTDDSIRKNILVMRELIEQKEFDEVEAMCGEILQQIKERNVKVKMSK